MILTETERKQLPGLFADSGLTPDSPAPDERLRQVVREHGQNWLGGRARRAFASSGDLETYLLGELRQELRDWDGNTPAPSGVRIGTSPRRAAPGRLVAELALFLEPHNGRLIPRLRFQGEAKALTPQRAPVRRFVPVAGCAPTLWTADAAGWSVPVAAEDGRPFDAARLDWEDDFNWRTLEHGSPRLLRFGGRKVRVFVAANRHGLAGFVEGDGLPACGRCWVAVGPAARRAVTDWLGRLPRGSYLRDTTATVPTGWHLYELKTVPTDPDLRNDFPGGAEDTDVRLRLRDGVRHRVGTREFFTFAPPRLEVSGEWEGVGVVVNGIALPPSEDGVYELPLGLAAGGVTAQAVKNGEILAEQTFLLVDSHHAGNPNRIHGWRDGTGHLREDLEGGWVGAWVEAEGLKAFNFDWLRPIPVPKTTKEAAPAPRQRRAPAAHQGGARITYRPDEDKVLRRMMRKEARLSRRHAQGRKSWKHFEGSGDV